MAEDYEAIDLSDTVHYRRLTVTGITFSENTAQVALLNNTGTALTAECQLITYRIRNNKKEYLSMERVPVNVASGTTSSPYQANIPVSFTRQTEPGRYQVLVRMMKHDLFTPLGQSATFSYEIK